ncbi:MAG: response regulator [Tannerella sp.]|jgi:ligand-binding sensor domain-containing protein/signal transduction histidine kinase/DNA-binding response OmpR family regulator|nr:response regulator [Tannerella sp.]
MKNLIIIPLIAFFPFIAKAEESFYFRHFSVENGLPQNTVNCIFQDQSGLMWFGTKDGLSRYDGYAFLNFRRDKDNPNSIGNNFIRSIFQKDSATLLVGTDNGVYVYHIATETFSRLALQTPDGVSIEKEVNDIKVDKDGNIWLAVDWQGVFRYSPENEKLTFYNLNIVNAWCICIDHENSVWIGTHGGGLNRYDRQRDRFEVIFTEREAGNDIYRLFQDNYNDLIIGTSVGIKKLSISSQQITPLFEQADNSRIFVRDIIRKSDHELYIGSESGVYICNTQNGTIRNIVNEDFDPYSLSDNAIYSMYKDREGGLWIGTYFGGVNYYPPQHTPFERFYPQNKSNSLTGKRIREFQEDRSGNLWIGTEDAGLNCYNPQTNMFQHFTADGTAGSLTYHNIHGLLANGNELWVGTFTHGLNMLDVKTRKIIRKYQKTDDLHSLCDNSIMAIYKDSSGKIWLGTIYGLDVYNPRQDNFTKINYIGDTFIYDIFQSYDGMMWFASFNAGVFRYNPLTDEWKDFKNDPEDPNSLPHNKIISIFEDSHKTVWFSTEGGGICKYNRENENFTSYSTKDGLPNNVVYKILEDNKGKLWLTTNNGLSCFNPSDGTVKTYTTADGLLGNQFNYKSGYKSPDGKLYFGGLNGFIAFNPLTFTENDNIPPVVITDFRLFNKTSADTLLKKDVNTRGEIHLKYYQSSFNIDFAALSYMAPEKNRYAYILEGAEKEWTTLTGEHTVGFSNIPPGTYVFRLKGSNNDGKWNETPTGLIIHIHPPFYKSQIAYSIYLIILLLFLFLLTLYSKKQLDKRNERRLKRFEDEKDKEIYNAKIAFFNNIAHEIRTPLSLIKGPVEYILNNDTPKEEMKENLQVIGKNTNRLLDLSNQLLDFRKVEDKGFRLNYVRSDIKQIINDVYDRFQLSARQNNRNFELQLPPENLFADIDREAFTKIISNLFTNAIKYSDSRIVLTLENTDNDLLILKIASDGLPVPEDMKEKIFEPFFRIGDENHNNFKSGIGLGLPLARSLAELHNGKLFLDTSSDNTNIFVLQLPVTQSAAFFILQEEEEQQETASVPEEKELFTGKPAVLVVEDDKEMRTFLYNQLKKSYNVMKAANGKLALDRLQKENIDIVVTDILMPEMDGLQLCAEIKSNVDTSHIPVIMLTAKADIQSRIEGLDVGADAYVTKPFSIEHLFAQISNIFTNRNKVKQAFINSPVLSAGSIALTHADEVFLGKVTQVINQYLQDESFNVNQLAEELNMSRSSLHRKIKGISELTPNDFIQLVRLKKAAELLKEGNYRINEVCYLVGFSSSSYFSKSFKKQFGVSPKESKRGG